MKCEFSKIDENNNAEKHYYYDQSLERWAKTARRWHDIIDDKQMYDTEIRNKIVVERTITVWHTSQKMSTI